MRYEFDLDTDRRAFLLAHPDAAISNDRGVDDVREMQADANRQLPSSNQDDSFAENARRILGEPKPNSVGKVHLLGLDRVKAHFGDHWDKLAPRIEALVERSIERRLTSKDVYRKTGGLNYVVLFAGLSDREAALKCGMMAEEISRMLVGDDMGAGMLEVQCISSEIDGAEILNKVVDPSEIAREIEKVAEQAHSRRAAAGGSPDKDELNIKVEDPLKHVRLAYRPIWDVQRSVAAKFVCTPLYQPPGRRSQTGDLPVLLTDTEAAKLKLDRMVMDHAIEEFSRMHQRGVRLPVCLPVHFESISTASRRRDLLDEWSKLPKEYRELATFEIVSLPDGIPQSRVAELVSALKVNAKWVLARLPIGTQGFRNFSDTGIAAVGAELAEQAKSDDRVMQELRSFALGAEKSRLPCYVYGVRSLSQMLGAVASGFSFVAGDVVSPLIDKPEFAYRLNLDDLYSRILPPQSSAPDRSKEVLAPAGAARRAARLPTGQGQDECHAT